MTPIIDNFINRVKLSTSSGSKDIRMSIQEANMLVLVIAEMLSKINQNVPTVTAPTIIDGGNFKNRN